METPLRTTMCEYAEFLRVQKMYQELQQKFSQSEKIIFDGERICSVDKLYNLVSSKDKHKVTTVTCSKLCYPSRSLYGGGLLHQISDTEEDVFSSLQTITVNDPPHRTDELLESIKMLILKGFKGAITMNKLCISTISSLRDVQGMLGLSTSITIDFVEIDVYEGYKQMQSDAEKFFTEKGIPYKTTIQQPQYVYSGQPTS